MISPAARPPASLRGQVNDTLAVLQQRFAALGLEPLKVCPSPSRRGTCGAGSELALQALLYAAACSPGPRAKEQVHGMRAGWWVRACSLQSAPRTRRAPSAAVPLAAPQSSTHGHKGGDPVLGAGACYQSNLPSCPLAAPLRRFLQLGKCVSSVCHFIQPAAPGR